MRPKKLTQRQAWLYIARRLANGNVCFSSGICRLVNELRLDERVYASTAQAMLTKIARALAAAGVRPGFRFPPRALTAASTRPGFLFPLTEEGQRQRAAFCRARARELKP